MQNLQSNREGEGRSERISKGGEGLERNDEWREGVVSQYGIESIC